MVERIGYKLSWLSRELRWINDPTEIEAWVASTKALSDLRWKMKQNVETVPRRDACSRQDHATLNVKRAYTISLAHMTTMEDQSTAKMNSWRPRRREKVARKVLNMDIDVEEPAKEVKKAQELPMPPLRSPRGKRGIKRGDGVMLKELGGMKSGDNDVGKRQKDWKKDPKAAVMKMLGIPSEGDKDGDGGLKEETKKDTKRIQNREIWRNGMLERVRKEKQPFEHWGHIKSANFKIMIGACAPRAVRIAVLKEMGLQQVDVFLWEELLKYYGKGTGSSQRST